MSPDLVRALQHLAHCDPDMAVARAIAGPLPDRTRTGGLATLMRIVVEQQLSVASADAIWRRLEAAVNPFTHDVFLALPTEHLRPIGLSSQKAAYCTNLARAVADGSLDLVGVEAMADADAIAHLSAVKGIGRWTAEIYLLFALGREDIWPAQDLALQVAVQKIKRLPHRPTFRELDVIAERWRPHRGVAARLLWRTYARLREVERQKAVA